MLRREEVLKREGAAAERLAVLTLLGELRQEVQAWNDGHRTATVVMEAIRRVEGRPLFEALRPPRRVPVVEDDLVEEAVVGLDVPPDPPVDDRPTSGVDRLAAALSEFERRVNEATTRHLATCITCSRRLRVSVGGRCYYCWREAGRPEGKMVVTAEVGE